MNAITKNTETAYAIDTETAYPIEVEVINELKTELLFYKLNRNEVVERKCRLTDRKVNKRIMEVVKTNYLEECDKAEANAEDAEEAYPDPYPIETDINPFDEVITQLKRYTPQTNIIYYHRIMMVDIVREVKNREEVGRVVNKKTGIKCNYSDKQKRQIFEKQLPALRRLTDDSFLDYQIKLYPFTEDTYEYHSPQAYPPITITLGDVLKETPIILPNAVKYNLIFKEYGKEVEVERTANFKYMVYSNYTVGEALVEIPGEDNAYSFRPTIRQTETFVPITSYPVSYLANIISDIIGKLSQVMVIPKPHRLYQRTRHQNKLLTLLVGMKKWNKKGNALLTGCKAQKWYDNDFVKVIHLDFRNYTTKGDLEKFMKRSGYIQTKLYGNTPITKKAIEKEEKIIDKTSYKDLALWLYKQY